MKKALIIGIDGVPYSLLNTYLKNDVMPNLKEILRSRLYASPDECIHP